MYFNPHETLAILEGDKDLQTIVRRFEQQLGKPLTNPNISLIVRFYKFLSSESLIKSKGN